MSVLSYNQNKSQESIFEELLHHFNYSLSGRDQTIMKYLLYSLNPNGFLEADTNEIAEKINTSVQDIERLISMLQNFEGKGIGSKNVISFLEFQLKQKNIYNDYFFSVFTSHLDCIHQQDESFLNSLDIDKDAFLSYVDLIKNSCDLFPVSNGDAEYLTPDASILIDHNNNFTIKINDCLLESVMFEPVNYDTYKHSFNRKIENYKKDYDELISILNARKIYLSDVLTIIVNVQKDYLIGNTTFLKTLDQNMLSEYTSLSPATISRLLHNKFISTPTGIVPIKSLLSKKYSENASVSYVMYLIKNLTDFKNMTDNKISSSLSKQGVSISRRTVNKYKNILLEQT
ncbi:hypothetical protein [Mammaliicoccus vitulinus]|uniref:RNA polymerase factor sigma-54 n=1 Tax=Mammaliicoccus vitulinus TaxID=71237 RepID=UPI00248B1968|nr:hypothetical protein [Mammaliicoccus vitulinus]